jgi:serine/threonine-protein kinase
VPDDLERVVLRCLAKDPDERFPDALSLELALAHCRDAAGWDAHRAARWWRQIADDATATSREGPNSAQHLP